MMEVHKFKVEQSKQKFAQSKQYLAGGVASSLRSAMKPVPLFAKSASGTRVRDVDDNEYIDYLLAYGPLILGHAHPVITEKIHHQMKQGYTYGLQHDGEIQLAERLVNVLPCVDKVALSGSGTEAVMLALRLAKAYTGRTKVVRFFGHYHGWSDTIFTAFPVQDEKQSGAHQAAEGIPPGTNGQSKRALEEVIMIPWNDAAVLEQTLRTYHDNIAAVITEPVMCNSGCIIPRPGYLEKMRELARELGIVMIVDEVITGFRLGLGGAHGRFGLLPDLVTVGKALGGGIAISAVGGRKEIMDLVDRGAVNHLGTLNGNNVAAAAALGVLEELAKDQGSVFNQMESLTSTLVNGIRTVLKKYRIPGIVNHIGPVFHMMFIDEAEVSDFSTFEKRDAARYATFAERLLEEGVLVRPNGLWYLSTVHTEEDVQQTLSAIDRVLRKWE